MKIYIAAKFDRRGELRPYAQTLTLLGHVITSRWLSVPDDVPDAKGSVTAQEAAEECLEDVRRADLLLFVGQPEGSVNRGGGRWIELGYALAIGKYIAIVQDGGPETVFNSLTGIVTYGSMLEAINTIGASRP